MYEESGGGLVGKSDGFRVGVDYDVLQTTL